MSEKHWQDLLDELQKLPDQRQAKICCGQVLLLIEHYGDVWVTMRELPPEVDPHSSRMRALAHETPWQFLRFGQSNYLCVTQHEMSDWRPLQALVDFRF